MGSVGGLEGFNELMVGHMQVELGGDCSFQDFRLESSLKRQGTSSHVIFCAVMHGFPNSSVFSAVSTFSKITVHFLALTAIHAISSIAAVFVLCRS